ncbi:MAG: dockerin type I repeat-containing protein [Planctomycetota bacterium]
MHNSRIALLIVAFLTAPLAAAGQDPNYVLSVTDAVSTTPGEADVRIVLENNGGVVDGWSFSVCHDNSMITPTQVTIGASLLPPTPPADYLFFSCTPDGVRALGIIDISPQGLTTGISPTPSFELAKITYNTHGPVATSTSVDLCDTVGTPPMVTRLVVVPAQGVTPTVVSGTVTIGVTNPTPPGTCSVPGAAGVTEVTFHGTSGVPTPGAQDPSDWPFVFSAPDQTVEFEPSTGAGPFSYTPLFSESGQGPVSTILGFSVSMAHDPAVLTIASIDLLPPLANMNFGTGPDYFVANIYTDGMNAAAVFGAIPPFFAGALLLTAPQALFELGYQTNPSTLTGSAGLQTTIEWIPIGLPDPANPQYGNTQNSVVVAPNIVRIPQLVPGSIDLIPPPSPYLAGDSNADGVRNIADAVNVLTYLFDPVMPVQIDCLRAADSNGDSSLNVADPVFLLQFLFSSGPPPIGPQLCGMPAPEGTLTCTSYPCP